MMVNQTKKFSLLLDVGNSSLKWLLLDSSGLSSMSHEQYPKNISMEFFKKHWQKLDRPNDIFVSCVADDTVWHALEKACDELWSIQARRVSSEKEFYGVVSAYNDVTTLGSDRWCALLGARDITSSAYMVIDAGSALTLDVVNASGEHLGGYIVPGMSMMEESLGVNTAQVQVSATDETPSLSLGRSTASCVKAGLHLSAIKLIEAVIEQELEQMQEYEVFITGGDAKLLKHFLSSKYVIIPDLVLRGLAVIAASTKNNN